MGTDGSHPARDLRSLLKAGVNGKHALRPRVLPNVAVNRVVYLRPSEVSAAGLYPLGTGRMLPSERALFDGDQWVTRELSPLELLSLKEIPEPLALLVSEQQVQRRLIKELFDSCKIPLKSLKAMLAPVLAGEFSVGKPEKGFGRREEDVRAPEGLHRVQRQDEVVEVEEGENEKENSEKRELECSSVLELIELLQRQMEWERWRPDQSDPITRPHLKLFGMLKLYPSAVFGQGTGQSSTGGVPFC